MKNLDQEQAQAFAKSYLEMEGLRVVQKLQAISRFSYILNQEFITPYLQEAQPNLDPSNLISGYYDLALTNYNYHQMDKAHVYYTMYLDSIGSASAVMKELILKSFSIKYDSNIKNIEELKDFEKYPFEKIFKAPNT